MFYSILCVYFYLGCVKLSTCPIIVWNSNDQTDNFLFYALMMNNKVVLFCTVSHCAFCFLGCCEYLYMHLMPNMKEARVKELSCLGHLVLLSSTCSQKNNFLNLMGWEKKIPPPLPPKKSKKSNQCGIFKPNDSIPVFLLADHLFYLLGKASFSKSKSNGVGVGVGGDQLSTVFLSQMIKSQFFYWQIIFSTC